MKRQRELAMDVVHPLDVPRDPERSKRNALRNVTSTIQRRGGGTPQTEAAIWFAASHGASAQEIAAFADVSVANVQQIVDRSAAS